jgi:hypothetical protein
MLYGEVVMRLDEAHGAGFAAHDDGMRDRAEAVAHDAAQHRAGGDAGGGEHHVPAGDFMDAVFAVGVGEAHGARALDLAVILEQKAALHLGIDAAQRRRRDHAFGCAARAEVDVDAAFRAAGGDAAGHVPGLDQHDARAGLTAFGHDLVVPFAVEQADDEVRDIHLLGAGEVAEVFGRRRVEIDHALRQSGADGDFLHVDVGGVEEAALVGEGDDGHAVGRALGDDFGAFEGVDGDIHLGSALADLLADIEHGGFVHLAFADDDGAGDGDAVEGMAHGFHGGAVGGVLVAAAGPSGGGDGGGLGDADEFEGEVPVGMLWGLEGHGCPRLLVRGAAARA